MVRASRSGRGLTGTASTGASISSVTTGRSSSERSEEVTTYRTPRRKIASPTSGTFAAYQNSVPEGSLTMRASDDTLESSGRDSAVGDTTQCGEYDE